MFIDRQMAWHQFAIAIDELEKAIILCPDELWEGWLWEDEADQWVAKGFPSRWLVPSTCR